MQNLRKTLAGAFIATTLLGGIAATPAFAGNDNGNDREYRQSYRHDDRYDDCDKESYWRHGEKKYYWDCDDNGKYDNRYDHDWHNGDRHDRDGKHDNRNGGGKH